MLRPLDDILVQDEFVPHRLQLQTEAIVKCWEWEFVCVCKMCVRLLVVYTLSVLCRHKIAQSLAVIQDWGHKANLKRHIWCTTRKPSRQMMLSCYSVSSVCTHLFRRSGAVQEETGTAFNDVLLDIVLMKWGLIIVGRKYSDVLCTYS